MEWIELQGPSSLAHSSRVHGHEISRVADGGGGVQPPGRGYGGGEGLGVAGGVRAPAAGPRHHQHAAPEDAHVLEEGGRVVEVAEHDADVLTALQRLLNCRAIAIIIREDEVQECGRRVAALPPTAVHLQTLHLQSSNDFTNFTLYQLYLTVHDMTHMLFTKSLQHLRGNNISYYHMATEKLYIQNTLMYTVIALSAKSITCSFFNQSCV